MKEFCKQKCENIFFHNVEPRFKNFKNKMKILSKKNNIIFNEDVFMDTLIKCSNTFSNKNATNEEIDNYFWVAFKQNNFSNFSRNKFNNTVKYKQKNKSDKALQDEYGVGSPKSKNEKALTGEMIKETCIPIKVDRLGNIIS